MFGSCFRGLSMRWWNVELSRPGKYGCVGWTCRGSVILGRDKEGEGEERVEVGENVRRKSVL